LADRAINQLPAATSVGTTDLFVLEQSNTAKSLTGQILINDLATALDGHGGIASIDLTSTSGLNKTYTITYADNTTDTFTVTDGDGIASITTYYAVSDSDTVEPVSWSTTPQTMTNVLKFLWTYQKITLASGNDIDTDAAVVGAYGDTGEQAYVYFKWASDEPEADSDMSDTPDAWVGICSTTSDTAPTAYTAYTWYQYKGATGDTGASITNVTLTSSSGLVDTYTIYFSNNTSTTFQVTNGNGIVDIEKTGTNGLQDTYTVTLTDGNTDTFTVTNGRSIVSITQTGGSHAAGTTDTYTILYNDNDTSTFTVYNGTNGTGAVSTVSGIQADGTGDVPQVVSGNGAPTTSTIGQVNQLYFDLNEGVLYYCLGESGGTYSWSATTMTVDTTLSTTSPNPIANSAITTKVGTVTLNTTATDLSSAVNEVLADIPTAVSDLTNDSGFVDATGAAAAAPVQSVNGQTGAVTVDPLTTTYTPASTDTASTVLAYGQAHPGKIFRWGGYAPATYTPEQTSTQWTYTLSNDYTGNANHVIFEAYDNTNGVLYRCKANGTWVQIANQPEVSYSNGSAVNVATGTATTVQTITLSAGVWALECDAQFASNATGYRGIHLATTSGGGTMDRHSTVQVQAANGVTTRLTFTTFFSLSASTTYYLVAEQNSGSTLSVTPGYKYMKFS